MEYATMEALIIAAETSKQMIHCRYQDLWFTPLELRHENGEGRFCWGVQNFEILPTDAYLDQAENQVKAAIEIRDNVIQHILSYDREFFMNKPPCRPE
jgi:hypothetical protein